MLEYTILVDDREKKPLPFPTLFTGWNFNTPVNHKKTRTVRLHTNTERLPTGDYVLAGFREASIVERKNNLDELHGNLVSTRGRQNFLAECQRLKDYCARPLIFLEGTPASLTKTKHADPSLTRDLIVDVLVQYDVPFWMMPTSTAPQRAKAAEWIVSFLLAGARHAPDS